MATETKPVLYLDLDGVLVDFVRPALRVHGAQLAMRHVTWDFCSQIGFEGVNDPEFWRPLGQTYWETLPWTSEGRALLAGLERLFTPQRILLVTSPCQTPGCHEGKANWVRFNIPEYEHRLSITTGKHMLAGPGKLLLDDRDTTVAFFRAEGGRALVVPRPWNILGHETDDDGNFSVPAMLSRVEAELPRLRRCE